MSHRHGVRRAAAAAVGVLLLGATACTDDEANVEPPPSQASPSDDEPAEPATSDSPAPTPDVPEEPVFPDDAYEPTAENAVRFVEFYWEVASYAEVTGDLELLRSLARPGCEACRSGEVGIEAQHASGAVVDQVRGYEVSGAAARPIEGSLAGFNVIHEVTTPEGEVLDEEGAVVVTLEPQRQKVRLDVRLASDGWAVQGGEIPCTSCG